MNYPATICKFYEDVRLKQNDNVWSQVDGININSETLIKKNPINSK